MSRTVLGSEQAIDELTNPPYEAVLKDEDGIPVQAAQLTSLTFTLYDDETGEIINSRNDINGLNANGMTLDSSGNLVWQPNKEDMAIVTVSKSLEVHVLLLEWIRNGGTRHEKHEVVFQVRNLKKVG